MLDIVHRLYENYDESYCKEKYLKSKSELLEMINSAMSDTDLKEELLCDTYLGIQKGLGKEIFRKRDYY